METSTTQRWQNGYRAGAGAFGVSGTTDYYVAKDVGSGIADQWPQRGDCWTPPNPTDDQLCSYRGIDSAFGRDTWRWEKHQHLNPVCSLVVCVPWTYEEEHLFQIYYIGGTENPDHLGALNYYYRPSEIRDGLVGNWAWYAPGSELVTWLSTALEYENAVDMSITEPQSFGGNISFKSTMKHLNTERVTTAFHLRSQVEVPYMNGFYRYDGDGSNFRAEFWSCEWNPGWYGPQDYTTCWDYGS